MDESDALSNPSDIVDGIDPSVDRIIMRCLEHSPDNRPDSVAAVATALPEGDPLAAALAAGETPSPELVAASKGVGSLSIPKAIACLAIIITGLALMLPMVRVTEVFNRLPLTLKPQALEQSAKEIVKAFGYPDPAADSDYGFSYDNQVLDLVKNPDSRELRDRMFATQVPTPYYFWYRHSPRRLIPGVPTNVTYMGNGTPQVTETDPPSMAPDAISVKLGPDGRLLRFAAFPSKITATPQTPDSKSANAPAGVSWNEILDKSGWSLTDARESDTLIITSVPHDHGRAWDAQMQSHPEITIHVEVRMFADQLTFFSATTSELQPSFWPPTRPQEVTRILMRVMSYFILIASVIVGGLNWWTYRVDRKGSFRFFLIAFGLEMLVFLCVGKQVYLETSRPLTHAMAFMLYTAFGVLMSYLAVEPYIRRFWPEVLVSWNRLVSGKIGDAMVGRDILIGVVAGVVNEVSLRSPAVMASWFDWPCEPLAITQLLALKGPRVTVGMIADVLQSSITFGLYLLTFMLVLRLCTKRTWITVSIYAILWAPVLFYIFGKVPHSWPVAVMITLLHIWIMTRYGLLAFVAFLFTAIVQQLPIAVDASMGYGWIRVLSYGSILGLAAYGFWTSTRLFDALQNNRMASV